MKKVNSKSMSQRSGSTPSERDVKEVSNSLSTPASMMIMPWSNFALSRNTLMRMRQERFGRDQISRLNLRVERPPDSRVFVAALSGKCDEVPFPYYGVITLDEEKWVLKTDGSEWEVWNCINDEAGTSNSYLIYFPTHFHGIIFDRVNSETNLSKLNHAKTDVNILRATQFKAMETLHVLEEVLKIKGLRKQMVHNYMETLRDSLLKEIEISGMKLLESLTHSSILVHRAASIHSRIVKVIVSACYAKKSV